MLPRSNRSAIAPYCVTAKQMQQIEARLFAGGMPVAALMEKVAGLILNYWLQRWSHTRSVGVLVGPGHNGGDALVVARELHLRGYQVEIYCPFDRLKPLSADHGRYCRSLGIGWHRSLAALERCDRILDGLFGFGLSRPLTGQTAAAVERVNRWATPVVSIDLPSGIHTDSGAALGTAIRADTTLCLGLWKQACLQDQALAYLGQPELIDFDIPVADIVAVLGASPPVQRLTPQRAVAALPLKRSPTAHKYTAGQLLLIAGSRQYAGAALLSGHGAVASGVGMVTLVVPESLRQLALAQLPGALVLGAPETPTGTIAALPEGLDLERYDAIACGPGLGREIGWLPTVVDHPTPLVLDADGLNATDAEALTRRQAATIITPHPGEFRRLFIDLAEAPAGEAATAAAHQTGAVVVLKGARTVIAAGDQRWHSAIGSAALARGGSGDVLTGLAGGLLAQGEAPEAALGAVWWHATTGCQLSQQRTLLGVDPLTLAQALPAALAQALEGVET